MAKVYIIFHTRTEMVNDSRYSDVTGIYKTLDSARLEIEKIRNEYRADDSITILGENWSLDEYPCYAAWYYENYFYNMYGDKRMTSVEFNVEEHELAE